MNTFTELLEKLGWRNKDTKESGEAEKKSFSERMRRLLKLGREFEKVPKEDVLSAILQSDIRNIQGTLQQVDKEAFRVSVELIQKARMIYIIGIRSCEPLAEFLSFYLNMMFDNVKVLHTSSASEIFEQMLRIGSEDVLIGISFPRYSMRTLKAMEFANDRNAKVIAITDSVHSPMNLYSSCNLIARSEMASVVDSLTAPLSLVNALVVALCLERQQEMREYLEKLENAWEEYQVYGADEMNRPEDHIEIYQAESKSRESES